MEAFEGDQQVIRSLENQLRKMKREKEDEEDFLNSKIRNL